MMAIAMFMTCVMNAQVKDQIQQSKDRSAKLEVLCKDYKTCRNAGIDGYGNELKNAALFAIANSVQLENMYKRQM